ncbi:MAG: hypothetical protein K2U26_07540, partial [Cyclobacteriaceae bacterium]|nr:hypothetical protein [Cyclobacteriaceae bacterium]
MRFFSSIVLLFAFSLVYGQGTKVLVQNTRGNRQDRAIVQVKWYSQNLIYPDGVNVYRRQVGETAWTKINAAPVVLKKNITPQQKQQDQDFEAFVDMASNLTKAKNAGFIILNVFAKTFQSEEFSKQIGIQFDDSSVRWGSDYEYRITRLEKGAEIEFGISPQLRVGPYQPSAAVKEFKADLKEKAVKMMWKPEADRFYGVNVYRSTSLDTARKKLNATPIVLSEHNENAPESDALFQDTDLKEGVTYFYDIAGLDFFSQETVRSERIEVKVGDLTPPPPPENLTKSVKVLNVRISWTTVHTVDLVGFYVYRSTLSDGPFIKITSQLIPKEDSVYVDPVDQPGFFYYHVASVDEAGNNGMSNPILAEVQDVIPPLPPQQVTATADTGKVTLRWKRNREPDLKGYYVFRSINEATTNFLLINAEPVRDTVFVQVLPENAINTFVFKVMAVDTSYNRSGYSAVVSAKLPDITSPIK